MVGGGSLIDAVLAGDAARVRALLETGADPEVRDAEGLTPLMLAAESGDEGLLAALISAGARVDARSTTSLPAETQLRDGVLVLEETGSFFNRRTERSGGRREARRTALMLAAEQGRAGAVAALLAAGADPDAADADGTTALVLAAAMGHAAVARRLLAEGADARRGDQRGETPLVAAAAEGHLELVRLLLEAGADPQAPGPLGVGPLHVAAGRGHEAVVTELLRAGASPGPRGLLGSPLRDAVRGRHAGVVKALLAGGADPTAPEPGQPSLLHEAIEHGSTELVALLAAGPGAALLELRDAWGRTPLLLAVELGGASLVQAALEAGADPAAPLVPATGGRTLVRPTLGFGPLHLAAARGDAALVGILTGRGAPLEARVEATRALRLASAELKLELELAGLHRRLPEEGFTPLALAARAGHAAVVEALLGAGADPDARTADGDTPLVLAGRAGHADVARLLEAAGADRSGLLGARLVEAVRRGDEAEAWVLLADGADPDTTDKDESGSRRPVLVVAAESGQPGLVRALVESGARVDAEVERGAPPWGRTALTIAAARGYAEVVRVLIDAGAGLEARERDFEEGGRTPLMLAAGSGSVTTVLALLKAGAQVAARDQEGLTPLMHAALSGHAEVVRLLLSHGARVDARCRAGSTALIYAAQEGHLEAVGALLDAGADVRVLPREGWSALVAAIGGGHLEVVQALLAAGADPDERGRDLTPLCQAVAEGDEGTFAALLEAGADATAPDAGGTTPLHAALLAEPDAFIEPLLAAGADPEARDGEGQTPLLIAAQRGRQDMVERLLAAGARLDARDEQGETALSRARAEGFQELVAWLEARGCPDRDPVAATQSSVGAVDDSKRARGLASMYGEDRALLVRAPVEAVAAALHELAGAVAWEPEALGKPLPAAARGWRVARLRGHAWSVVQPLGGAPLLVGSGRVLSARLGAEALWIHDSDAQGSLSWRRWEAGRLVEQLDWGRDPSSDETLTRKDDDEAPDGSEDAFEPDETRYWTAERGAAPLEIDDPYELTDARLRALQAWVPSLVPEPRPALRVPGVGDEAVERLDWVAAPS